MGHITFVHGIANKPDWETLLGQWRVALYDDDGLDLDALGVTTSMVYWADMLYAEPAPDEAAREATTIELEQSVAPADADLSWLVRAPSDEQAFVQQLARSVGLEAVAPTPTESIDPVRPGSALEAVPLPGPLKRRLMRVFLRDVHHYLWNVEYSPRPGESYRIRTDARARMLASLQEGDERPAPHVVVAHSLGTVIAYDVLASLDQAPQVDALLTVGSPLGISEVEERLTPPWTRENGWPAAGLGDGVWWNFYDLLDPVCGGLDARIGEDFRCSGKIRLSDVGVHNRGSWRHAVAKYLGQQPLRNALWDILQ
jgi:hypothetical protein